VEPTYQYAPPSAAALIESLRGVGYSAEAAVADLIDNSVSVGAPNVWLNFRWDGARSSVTILDDGSGMDEVGLFEAMRLGAKGPSDKRDADDLGRFGLGLKTASFGVCKRLTVASKKDGNIVVRRWDLDHIRLSANDWHLLVGPAPGSEHLLQPLSEIEKGTIVIWELLDRFSGATNEDVQLSQTAFLQTVERIEKHLAMVFHHYLEGSSPDVSIFINGRDSEHRVKPWAPFLTDHPATIRRPIERIPTTAGTIEVQGYVLPHKDQLTRQQYEEASGVDGWTAQQGFYVYRNRRLLVAGSWLGLGVGKAWTKEEAHKLARLRLEIPNTADEEWQIDIKKSVARPPQFLRSRLRRLAEDARSLAREVFAHRGSHGPRAPIPELVRVWSSVKLKDTVRYGIERDHPAVRAVLDQAGPWAEKVDAMLRVIEETVPIQRIWLDSAESGELQQGSFSAEPSAEVVAVLEVIYRDLCRRVGLSSQQAVARLLRTDPFHLYPDLVTKLPDRIEE
jgi:hypothetical protein